MYARHQIVQRFLDLFPAPHYLEIGVNQGETFLAVQARRKVAVDPKFLMETKAATTDYHSIEFHEITSDEYFVNVVTPAERFDVIYLDGLHTFEQTLRDLLNATFYIKPAGVIILDDVIPSSYPSSLPVIPEWHAVRVHMEQTIPNFPHDGSWMGDVYKTVFFMQTFMQQYTYATVTENHGQSIVWRQPRPVASIVERHVQDIGLMQFKDVVARRPDFQPLPIDSIVALVKANMMRF